MITNTVKRPWKTTPKKTRSWNLQIKNRRYGAVTLWSCTYMRKIHSNINGTHKNTEKNKALIEKEMDKDLAHDY